GGRTRVEVGSGPVRGNPCPAAPSSGGGGARGCALGFISDEIKPASDYEHEHEYEHETTGLRRNERCEKCAFHPAGDAKDKKKSAGPDQGSNPALGTEHGK